MKNINEHINALNAKLQVLLKKYAIMQKENESLKKEVHQLNENEKRIAERINFLEMQTSILKASSGTMEPGEKADFEKRINQYLKDIDKCIAILNN